MVASTAVSLGPLTRRTPVTPVRIVADFDGQDLLDASLALAHTQLVAQLTDEATLDARMTGTLGLTGALLAADLAAKDFLAGSAWWIMLIVITCATACCLSPAFGIGRNVSRCTDVGPDPVAFYNDFVGRPPRRAREQLLADLRTAVSHNARRLSAKQHALRAALLILAFGLVASTAVVILDQPSTTGAPHAHHHTNP